MTIKNPALRRVLIIVFVLAFVASACSTGGGGVDPNAIDTEYVLRELDDIGDTLDDHSDALDDIADTLGDFDERITDLENDDDSSLEERVVALEELIEQLDPGFLQRGCVNIAMEDLEEFMSNFEDVIVNAPLLIIQCGDDNTVESGDHQINPASRGTGPGGSSSSGSGSSVVVNGGDTTTIVVVGGDDGGGGGDGFIWNDVAICGSDTAPGPDCDT